ncbi:MAG: fibrobacter succinogenes major paralogous domain-containing protein [Bacteroidales bacterium]|nr:fibrobacter succinogenes major paralogous domain-containing protein [Bacteroidales bacterium]
MKRKNGFWIFTLIPLGIIFTIFNSCDKDDGKENPGDVTSRVILYDIEDFGYTYAVCKGTFEHNNNSSFVLDDIYCSDISDKPSSGNSINRHVYLDGFGAIQILKDTLGIIDFECFIWELENNTKYNIRCAYTINNFDTVYSNLVTFTTKRFKIDAVEFNSDLIYGQIKDIDNNTYKTIEIGAQTWMAENLKTTKFNDGTSIPLITNAFEFESATTPAYCYFNNDEVISEPLGLFYNWYVIEYKNVCPAGWHVPSADEWDLLNEFITHNYHAPAKALASKTNWMESYYNDGNVGYDMESNDSTGFSAIAAGAYDGGFGDAAVWWSLKEENNELMPSSRWLARAVSIFGVNRSDNKNMGYSIRCIKD